MPHNDRYVLVTAAHNERGKIEYTIASVLEQSVSPVRWVIVSDGSTDGTEELVREYAEECDFIQLISVSRPGGHSFVRKVEAIRLAEAELAKLDYEYFGVLDADVTFGPDYFEGLLAEFRDNPKLGIAGGEIVQDVGRRLESRIKSLESVAGAVQMFRAACFRDSGGLQPLRYGGEDAAAEIVARMRGWEVRTFPEFPVIHQGYVGARSGGRLRVRFRSGQMNYQLGYHPIFEIARCVFRVVEEPYIVGSFVELLGFVAAWLRYRRPSLGPDVVRYLREEQLSKLEGLFVNRPAD